MPDFHLGRCLVSAALLLVRVVSGTPCFFGRNPRREEGGGIEVGLEVAEDLGRGDGGGLVDRWEVQKGLVNISLLKV